MKTDKVTYTAEQIFAQAKAVKLAAKLTRKPLPDYLQDRKRQWGWVNLNRITNRDVALFSPYLPGLRCQNLREVVKAIGVKQSQRNRANFQNAVRLHEGWSVIPDAVKDRIAQAIWERKGRPNPCKGVTDVRWGVAYGEYLGCRGYLSPTGRLFAAFKPPLTLVDWDTLMRFTPEGTEVG